MPDDDIDLSLVIKYNKDHDAGIARFRELQQLQ